MVQAFVSWVSMSGRELQGVKEAVEQEDTTIYMNASFFQRPGRLPV
jgi:hypothetical protein